MDRLVAAVESLAGDFKIIREILDRVLDDFQWALNNDKLRPECCLRTFELVHVLLDREADTGEDSTAAPGHNIVEEPANNPAAVEERCQRDLFS